MSIFMQLKYKTKFTDKNILKKALEKANIEFTEHNEDIFCDIDYYDLHFAKTPKGEYEIKTEGYNDWKEYIKDFRDEITKYYEIIAKEQIQVQICKNIKEKVAKNSSMKLEQEEILEDNSVLLTISV